MALYGRAGTGKTTLASTFPKPLLVIDCNERGTDSIRDVKGVDVIRVADWEDIDNIYWMLKKENHGYKTVVIDTLSQVQDMKLRSMMLEQHPDMETGRIGDWGTMTQRDWGTAASSMKTFILSMRDLENLNIIFVTHDRVFNESEGDDEDNNTITPSVGPRLMPSVAATLNAAVSIIGNTFVREEFSTKLVGKGRKKTKQKTRKVIYGLRVGPHSYYITKIRKPKGVKLPEVLDDPSYKSLMTVIKG